MQERLHAFLSQSIPFEHALRRGVEQCTGQIELYGLPEGFLERQHAKTSTNVGDAANVVERPVGMEQVKSSLKASRG